MNLEGNNQYQGQLDCPDTTFSTKGDDAVINLLDDIPEPEALLYINTIMALSLGNISVSGGKQKSRKTFFQIMLIVASLLGRWGCLQGVSKEDSKVLLFDTEMGKTHVLKTLKRIYSMMGWNEPNERLKVYYLREYGIDERIEIIKAQIEKHHPLFVIIDGAVDICKDFNSIDEASKTVQFLMDYSARFNCHISVVLHENKVGGNLRGHLGTILMQKAETAIKLVSDGTITTVSAEATRNMPFEEMCFRVDEDGIPQTIEVEKHTKEEVQTVKIGNAMKVALGLDSMEYTTLCKELSEQEGVAESTTKKWISSAQKKGIIKKGSDGRYRMA